MSEKNTNKERIEKLRDTILLILGIYFISIGVLSHDTFSLLLGIAEVLISQW